MALTSLEFAVFVFAATVLYYTVFSRRQWIFLLFVSYIYYMASGVKNIVFLMAVTVITYMAGILMQKTEDKRRRKKILVLALFLDFLILASLKYTNFFINSVNEIFFRNNPDGSISFLNLLLPLGISFFTFQSAGYMLDVYWKRSSAEKNFFRYALFVSFFPQLVAGPIERSKNLLREIVELPTKKLWNYERITKGLMIMLWGYFMKMVLADRIAILVDHVYNSYYMYGSVELLIATVGFAFQIYCDFSSYSTIAIGAAQVMGFTLMENFDTPYFAQSIKEFWRRWHISLSTWFRDYVYIPRGGE